MNTSERFWCKVDKNGPGGCWVWTAGTTVDGYPRFRLNGKGKKAHRVSYEWLIGPIPEGFTLDHLCRNRACVNPVHLEPVTSAENTLRGTSITAINAAKTHCKHGHALTQENVYRQPDGGRACRVCREKAQRRWVEKNRETIAARKRAKLRRDLAPDLTEHDLRSLRAKEREARKRLERQSTLVRPSDTARPLGGSAAAQDPDSKGGR